MTKRRGITKPRARPHVVNDTDDAMLQDTATAQPIQSDAGETADDTWRDVLDAVDQISPVTPKTEGKRVAGPAVEPADDLPRTRRVLQTRQPPPRVISLDDGKDKFKLSRKQQEELASKWHGDNHGAAVDAYFESVCEDARRKSGHRGVFMGSDLDRLVIGIPMFGGHGDDAIRYPGCLPMEYVIAQDVFPLGLVIQIVAFYGTGKSGLLAEFGRWFDLAGGGMELNENETKFSRDWYRSIMGHQADTRLQLHRCNSVEDWQRSTTSIVNRHKKFMIGTKEKPGPGRTIPVLIGVDSVMGKMTEEIQEKILGERLAKNSDVRGETGKGAAERSHAIEANIITKYMRTIPQELDNWPFALVLINHLRMNKDENGHPVRHKGGGEQTNFQESFELEIAKIGGFKKRIECVNFEGFPLEISCAKSSFGPTHRKVQTRVLWWEEENPDGSWYQRTVWDWDWSTINLLNGIVHGNTSVRLKQNLIDAGFHLACPKSGEVDNAAWSKTLGMKEDDAVPWHELGQRIRCNFELMEMLRKALRINRRPLLQGDYLRQMNKLAAEIS